MLDDQVHSSDVQVLLLLQLQLHPIRLRLPLVLPLPRCNFPGPLAAASGRRGCGLGPLGLLQLLWP